MSEKATHKIQTRDHGDTEWRDFIVPGTREYQEAWVDGANYGNRHTFRVVPIEANQDAPPSAKGEMRHVVLRRGLKEDPDGRREMVWSGVYDGTRDNCLRFFVDCLRRSGTSSHNLRLSQYEDIPPDGVKA